MPKVTGAEVSFPIFCLNEAKPHAKKEQSNIIITLSGIVVHFAG